MSVCRCFACNSRTLWSSRRILHTRAGAFSRRYIIALTRIYCIKRNVYDILSFVAQIQVLAKMTARPRIRFAQPLRPVSYTHLTLPTICSV